MIAFAETETLLLDKSELSAEFPPTPPAKSRKPRVWTAFATLFVATIVGQIGVIAAFMVVGIVTGILMGAAGADAATIQARVQEITQKPLPTLLLCLIPFQLGMTLVVLFAARRSKTPLKERVGLLPQTGRKFNALRLTTMAAFTVSAALASLIVSSLFIGAPPEGNPISAVITDGSWLAITFLSITLSVIPALVEETLFRGYIQRRFLERWSPAVAIGVTTLLFAIMHMDSLQHIIAVVPLGVITGLLAYRSNSVKPGMLVHGIHNVAAVGFSALFTAVSPIFGEEGLGMLIFGVIGVLGVIGLPAVISLFRGVTLVPAVEEVPVVAAPVAKTPSVLPRESRLPEELLTGSRLTGSAV